MKQFSLETRSYRYLEAGVFDVSLTVSVVTA